MGKFAMSVSGFTTSTGLTTAMGVGSNTSGQAAEIVEVVMTGSGGDTAVDTQHRFNGTVMTLATTGVSTTATPEPFHQNARASQMLAGTVFTTEPTVYSSQPTLVFGFNQRGGMRWAVPQGEGIYIVGGKDDDGFGARIISVAAGKADGHMHFWEQG